MIEDWNDTEIDLRWRLLFDKRIVGEVIWSTRSTRAVLHVEVEVGD
jgi:hypothetical protein